MEKGPDYLFSVVLLTGSLVASGAYLGAFHLFPAAAGVFLALTVILAALGLVKLLNHIAPYLPLQFSRLIHWIHSMVFEAFAVSCSFFMRPFGYIKTGPFGSKNGRPILLIHGYLQNGSNWAYLKRALSRKGFGPLYTLNLAPPFRSIREYAASVSEQCQRIAKETGRADIAFIGHSMGGLVVSWYAAKLAPSETDVVTIGSPLAGTWVARVALGDNGREMRRGSDFVQELYNEIAKNERSRFFHIASKADQIVIPYTSALTGIHPERELVLDDIGHMTLLASPRVADQIGAWLNEAIAKLPDPAKSPF